MKSIPLIIMVLGIFVIKNSLYAKTDSFLESFNLLNTVAGKGGTGNGDENEWDEKYEGKPAIEAVLSRPHFTMADSVGNIYIADKNAHAIRKVDVNGIISTVAGTNEAGDGGDGLAVEQELNSPNGLWVNRKGEFYILDLGNSKIRKVDSKGNMVTLFKDDEGISLGRGLWLNDAEDTVWYSSGSRVKIWTENTGIGTYSDGFSALGNIVQDHSGYVVATDRSANLVYRINNDGTKTVIAGNGKKSGGGVGLTALETAFYGVRGIWFVNNESYLLATHEGSRVWYIDNNGLVHLFLDGREGDEYHSGDGMHYRTEGYKVSEVRAVSIDYQGNVLVTENDCGYIRKVKKNANFIADKKLKHGFSPVKLKVNTVCGFSGITFYHSDNSQKVVGFFNQLGRRVQIPVHYKIVDGIHEVWWNNRNIPCGAYFISIQDNKKNYYENMINTR